MEVVKDYYANRSLSAKQSYAKVPLGFNGLSTNSIFEIPPCNKFDQGLKTEEIKILSEINANNSKELKKINYREKFS
jgi:hypothetical protein